MRAINKLLTLVAVALCFFGGAASGYLSLMALSVVIALVAFVLEAYALARRARRWWY